MESEKPKVWKINNKGIKLDQLERRLIEGFKRLDAAIKRTVWAKPIDKSYSRSSVLVVGGWVRDKIWIRDTNEVDIIVQKRFFELTRKQIIPILESVFEKGTFIKISTEVHLIKSCKKKRFCLMVKPLIGDSILIDVTDSRDSLIEDYKSRDFTLNTLYYDPLDESVLALEQSVHLIEKPEDRLIVTVDEVAKVMTFARSIRAVRFKYLLKLKLALELEQFLKFRARAFFVNISTMSRGIQRTVWREILKLAVDKDVFVNGLCTLFKYEMLPESIGKISHNGIKPLKKHLLDNWGVIHSNSHDEKLEMFVQNLHEIIEKFRLDIAETNIDPINEENIAQVSTEDNVPQLHSNIVTNISKPSETRENITPQSLQNTKELQTMKASEKNKKQFQFDFQNLGDDVEDMNFTSIDIKAGAMDATMKSRELHHSQDFHHGILNAFGIHNYADGLKNIGDQLRQGNKQKIEEALKPMNDCIFFKESEIENRLKQEQKLVTPTNSVAKDIFTLINNLRSDPTSFIKHLENRLQNYSPDGHLYRNSTGFVSRSREGVSGCQNAIQFIKIQKALPKLNISIELSKAAQEFCDDAFNQRKLKVLVNTGLFDSEGNNLAQICAKHIPIGGNFGEIECYNSSRAVDIMLCAVICDFDIVRQARRTTFDESFKYIGVGFNHNEKINQTIALVVMVEAIGKKAKNMPLTFPNLIFNEMPDELIRLIHNSTKPITGIKKERVKEGSKRKDVWTVRFRKDDGSEVYLLFTEHRRGRNFKDVKFTKVELEKIIGIVIKLKQYSRKLVDLIVSSLATTKYTFFLLGSSYNLFEVKVMFK